MELLLSNPPEPDIAAAPPLDDTAELLPLSFAQQRLWFLDQLHPQSPQYNVPAAFRLRGALGADALERSIQTILQRHEILRTVYVRHEGEPAQRIRPEPAFELPRAELTLEELPQRLHAEAIRPFDLEQDLMLRAALFKLAHNDHVLFLNTHHIAFDEWSMQILWRELAACYAAWQAGAAPTLEELPIQYADFAAWQRENTANWNASEKRWREVLSGDLPRLELPSSQGSAAARSDRGARDSLSISPALAAELRALCRREVVTMHVLLLTAFQILLRRLCPQDDIIIGVPFAGRTHFQTEPLIGFFVNTLPVRASFAGDPTFRELLQAARQQSLETCGHQDLPFDHIVELVRAPRSPGRNPIFDVVFSTQQTAGSLDFCGLKVELIEVGTGTAKFDLTFVAQDRGDQLAATVEYRSDLLEAELIRQMIGGYQSTLQAIVERPEASVSSLSLPAAKSSAPARSKSSVRRSAPDTDQPQTRFQRKLRDIWKNVLGHDAFGAQDDFFEIGGHSLLAVKLIAQVENAFGKKLPLPILFRAPTIEKMAEALADDTAPALGSCLVEIQPRGSRPPIFWLHTLGGGGGGGLFTYRKLAEALGPDQPSFGFVASPQPFPTIETMAERYIQEMRSAQPCGPYRLGGYCFGGVVAYEMARQLEASGESVAALALLDSSPPDPTGERTRPSLKLAWHAISSLPRWLLQLDAASVKNTFQRLGARFKRRREAAPQLEQFVDMTHYPADYRRFAQAHWHALMHYKPGPYHGPATLFKTDERHLFRLDSVKAWRQLIGPRLQVRRVPGKHEQILEDPHVKKLAAQLTDLLA